MSNEFYEFMGNYYTWDDEQKAWLVQVADYDWYFSKEVFAKTFIGLVEQISKFADIEDVIATYNFSDDVDDKAIQYLAIKYIKLLDRSNS